MKYFMQFIKNKILRLFIALCAILPLHGMFSKKAFDRMKRIQQKTAQQQQRSFQPSQPINIKSDYKPNITKTTATQKPTFLSWFSNWWNSPSSLPLEEKLSNWSTNVGTTIQTTATNVSTALQSKQILYKLRKARFVSSSLSETIQPFLENNNSDDIKDVFNEVLKHSGGGMLLEKIYINNPSLIVQILPLMQEALTDPNLITTPVSKFSYESQNILPFTSKILLLLSHSTDSTQIHTINAMKQQLLQILIAHPFYATYIDTGVLLTILPDDIDDFISTINNWNTQIGFDVRNTGEMDRQYNQSFIYRMSDLLAQKIVNEKIKENREKLCAIILEKHYADQIIERIAPKNKDVISDIISAFKKKLLTSDIYKYNFHSLTREIFNLAEQSDPFLAKDLNNDIISTLKKKLLTDDIYKESFHLLTINTLNLTAKKNPLLVKDFTNAIISILKEKLLTDNVYNENFCSLTIDIVNFASYTNPSLAQDLTNSIKAQFKKASKSHAGLTLLTNIFHPSEILERTLNINKEYAETASYKHLEKYASNVIQSFPTLFSNPNLIAMIQAAIKKEKEENDLEKETFFHGRRREYGLVSYFFKKFFEHKSGKKLDNFEFTQLHDPVIGEIHPRFFPSEEAKQERLVREGNIFAGNTKTNPIGLTNRQSLLFLNKFLFGNTAKLGSSSIFYVLANHNAGNIEISMQEIFAMFGYSDIYTMYEQKLQNLQKKYNNLSQYGELLLIAIPKKNVDKCVYYTTSGGPKISFNIPGVGETTDIKQILSYQNAHPQDVGEYVATATHGKYGILNPDSGTTVTILDAVDPDKKKALEEERDDLVSDIIKTITEKDTEKEITQRSRE